MAITLDGSTPASWALSIPSTGGLDNDESGTSASFTPPVGSVIVVCALGDTGAGVTPTFSVSHTGFSSTEGWITHVQRGDAEGTAGFVAIASAVVTTSAAGTVTVTLTDCFGDDSFAGTTRGRAWADVWIGADTSAGSGRLADATPNEGSSTTNNITPTAANTITANARVIGVAADWNALGLPTSTDTEEGIHLEFIISGLRAYKASDSTSGTSPTLNFDASGTGAADWNWCAIALKVASGAAATSYPFSPAGRLISNLICQ